MPSITIPPSEYFRSVELIWPLWLASLLGLTWLIRIALRGLNRQTFRRLLLRREDGSAYALVYIMTLPLFMLVVCLVIETTLILIVKMGTIYAAYAAARSHIVWASTKASEAEDMTQLAAVQALAPFASGNRLHAAGTGLADRHSDLEDATGYVQAYRKFAPGSPGSDTYIQAKYNYAAKSTRTDVETTGEWDADVKVTVKFDMPLTIPGIGKFLSTGQGGGFLFRRIESRAILQNEGSQADSPDPAAQPLGISYEPQQN